MEKAHIVFVCEKGQHLSPRMAHAFEEFLSVTKTRLNVRVTHAGVTTPNLRKKIGPSDIVIAPTPMTEFVLRNLHEQKVEPARIVFTSVFTLASKHDPPAFQKAGSRENLIKWGKEILGKIHTTIPKVEPPKKTVKKRVPRRQRRI